MWVFIVILVLALFRTFIYAQVVGICNSYIEDFPGFSNPILFNLLRVLSYFRNSLPLLIAILISYLIAFFKKYNDEEESEEEDEEENPDKTHDNSYMIKDSNSYTIAEPRGSIVAFPL